MARTRRAATTVLATPETTTTTPAMTLEDIRKAIVNGVNAVFAKRQQMPTTVAQACQLGECGYYKPQMHQQGLHELPANFLQRYRRSD